MRRLLSVVAALGLAITSLALTTSTGVPAAILPHNGTARPVSAAGQG